MYTSHSVFAQYTMRGQPGVAEVYGVLVDHAAGVVGAVMELADRSLRAALDDVIGLPRVSAEMSLGVLLQTASALAALHRHVPPIVHADVKAANVLVRGSAAMLTDFGSARLLEDLAATVPELPLSTLGTLERGGTPRWRAPELFGRRAQRPSPASDVYSFGVLMYEVGVVDVVISC